MSYTINLTNGTTLVPGGLGDGTVDTAHTSLTLIGRDYAGYGQFLNENFVYLLENFANNTGPANPLKGQLWWDTTNNILRVWSGSSWKISTGATASPYSSPPGDLSALGGDLWFDTTNTQLKVWSGSQWVTVGPVATPATGDSGAQPALIADTSSGTHIVIEFKISGVVYAILSKDTFSSALSGFTTIKAGLNFSTVATPSWVISTQDTNATPSTLVQRDTSGGINASTVTGTAVVASTVNATNIFATNFNGNLTGNVSASTITSTNISAQGLTASLGYTGSVLTSYQPNITTVGTLTGLAVSGATALSGTATLNGVGIATVGGSAPYSSVNAVIGNIAQYSGQFTTITASAAVTPVTSANAAINLGASNAWWGPTYVSSLNVATSVTAQSATLNSLTTGTATATTGYITTVSASTVNTTNSTVSGTITATTGNIVTVNSTTVNAGTGAFTTVGATNGSFGGTLTAGTGSFTTVNASGTVTAAAVNATSATFTNLTLTNPLSLTNVTVQNLNIGATLLPTTTNIDVGSSASPFRILYGTALNAEYADLAERYASDTIYPAGTVVKIGGTAEVTKVDEELSEDVFGVISTLPGFLLNGSAGSNDTHPPVALTGRVPVRVVGTVNKGDRLVSAGNGLARAGSRAEITPFNVIGRALETKTTVEEGVIEATVKMNS